MFVYYRNADESRAIAQARSQVLGFGRETTFLEDKLFVFIICLNKNFSGHKEVLVGTKSLRGNCPRMPPPWLRACHGLKLSSSHFDKNVIPS